MYVMKLNKEAIELIKKFEGCKLNAYKDSVGIPTIGYGNTYYENGVKVKMGDVITIQRAEELLKNTLDKFSANVEKLIKTTVTENQFGALVSLAYNIGIGNLTNSTLLKKVNANASDTSIRGEFLKWNKAGGTVLTGLTNRRALEADLYFKP